MPSPDAAFPKRSACCPDPSSENHHAGSKHRIEDYLRFATDPNTSFDNNAVEREISMVELGTAARIGDVDDERVLVGGVCDPTGD